MLFIVARRCCFFSWEFPSKYFTIIILDNDFKSLKFFFVSFESSVVFILVPFIICVSMKFDAYFYVQHTPKHKSCFYFYTPNQCKLESVTIQCFDLGCCFSRRKKVSRLLWPLIQKLFSINIDVFHAPSSQIKVIVFHFPFLNQSNR